MEEATERGVADNNRDGKRCCSLMRSIRIEEADVGAWRALEQFHYRHGAGAIGARVFAAYLDGWPRSAGWDASRVVEALAEVGINKGQLSEPTVLRAAVEGLTAAQRRFVMREMNRFAQLYKRHRDGGQGDELGWYVEIVSRYVLGRPVYYLWRREGEVKS